MATLIDDEDPSLVPFSRGMIRPEDLIEEEIPVPNGRMLFGETPYRGPSMNETMALLPQTYGTASDNAYLSEQRALAGLDPRSQRQQALLKAEIEEQAMRTAGQLEYQQLVQGGALPEEAYRRVAGKLNWNHPDKLALALDRLAAPGVIPGSVNSVPILGDRGARIGDAVYGSKGELHATRFSDPNRLTPAQILANQIDKEKRVEVGAELATTRAAEAKNPAGWNTNNPPRIAELQKQQEALRAKAVGGATEKDERVRVTSPDGKTGTVMKSKLAEALKAGYKAF